MKNNNIKRIIDPIYSKLSSVKKFIIDWYTFYRGYSMYRKEVGNKIKITMKPIIGENTVNTSYDRHYIYFPSWGIRKILQYKPSQHFDFSSSLIFSTMLSAIIPTYFYDIRPPKVELKGLRVGEADLVRLPFGDNSIESISCMHVIEHIGLGRYGDPFDVKGDVKAMRELSRVLKIGGNLLVVVPVGIKTVYYNAHRVYSYSDIIRGFSSLKLIEFSLIKGAGNDGIITNADPKLVAKETFGCGCYWFKKERHV